MNTRPRRDAYHALRNRSVGVTSTNGHCRAASVASNMPGFTSVARHRCAARERSTDNARILRRPIRASPGYEGESSCKTLNRRRLSQCSRSGTWGQSRSVRMAVRSWFRTTKMGCPRTITCGRLINRRGGARRGLLQIRATDNPAPERSFAIRGRMTLPVQRLFLSLAVRIPTH